MKSRIVGGYSRPVKNGNQILIRVVAGKVETGCRKDLWGQDNNSCQLFGKERVCLWEGEDDSRSQEAGVWRPVASLTEPGKPGGGAS